MEFIVLYLVVQSTLSTVQIIFACIPTHPHSNTIEYCAENATGRTLLHKRITHILFPKMGCCKLHYTVTRSLPPQYTSCASNCRVDIVGIQRNEIKIQIEMAPPETFCIVCGCCAIAQRCEVWENGELKSVLLAATSFIIRRRCVLTMPRRCDDIHGKILIL